MVGRNAEQRRRRPATSDDAQPDRDSAKRSLRVESDTARKPLPRDFAADGDRRAAPSTAPPSSSTNTLNIPPSLRRRATDASSPPAAPAKIGQPIESPTDPRWVLALRTAEALDGAVLPPERRDRLVRLGKLLGLTPFDANLVIAIVQDQARRGYAPEYCPAAGEAQLRMVPLRDGERDAVTARKRRVLRICFIITALIGVELLILKWLFA